MAIYCAGCMACYSPCGRTKGNDMSELEIETKYEITNSEYAAISRFMKTVRVAKQIVATGHDHLYRNAAGKYLRYRVGEGHHEMTVKSRIKGNTNMVRTEIEFMLMDATPEKFDAFAKEIGFEPAYVIRKNTEVWWLNNRTNVAIYQVFDHDNSQIGTFAEIEADKNVHQEDAVRLIEDTEHSLARQFPSIFRPDLRLPYTMTEWLEKLYA